MQLHIDALYNYLEAVPHSEDFGSGIFEAANGLKSENPSFLTYSRAFTVDLFEAPNHLQIHR